MNYGESHMPTEVVQSQNKITDCLVYKRNCFHVSHTGRNVPPQIVATIRRYFVLKYLSVKQKYFKTPHSSYWGGNSFYQTGVHFKTICFQDFTILIIAYLPGTARGACSPFANNSAVCFHQVIWNVPPSKVLQDVTCVHLHLEWRGIIVTKED